MRALWKDRVFIVLFSACLLLLFGRAYQHIYFEAPYRSFFLKEAYFGWAIHWFSNMNWADYVNSLDVDYAIHSFGLSVGIFFLCTAFLIYLLNSRFKRTAQILCGIASVLLAFMAFSYYLDKGYQLAQIMEYTAQVATPSLLAWYVANPKSQLFNWVIKTVVGLTFLGHGLYALGLYPVPGYFVHMVISNLDVTNTQAEQLLLAAGWMDVGVAVGVFIPKIDRYWLIYAVVWGFLTALARLTTYILWDHMFWLSVHQIGFAFLIRTPHFLLPLAALWRKKQ